MPIAARVGTRACPAFSSANTARRHVRDALCQTCFNDATCALCASLRAHLCRIVNHLPDPGMQHALLHVKRSLTGARHLNGTATSLYLLCNQVLRSSLGINLLTRHAVKESITGHTEVATEGCSTASNTVSEADHASSPDFVHRLRTDIVASSSSPRVSLLAIKVVLEMLNAAFFIAMLFAIAAEGVTCSVFETRFYFHTAVSGGGSSCWQQCWRFCSSKTATSWHTAHSGLLPPTHNCILP